jgi:hypothetical protein
MEVSLSTYLVGKWPVVVIIAILGVLCVLTPSIRYRAQLSQLPLLNSSQSSEEQRKAFLESAHDLYLDGYAKVHAPFSLCSFMRWPLLTDR